MLDFDLMPMLDSDLKCKNLSENTKYTSPNTCLQIHVCVEVQYTLESKDASAFVVGLLKLKISNIQAYSTSLVSIKLTAFTYSCEETNVVMTTVMSFYAL
jgi:hypothetical protein